jgi:hypothetical protein
VTGLSTFVTRKAAAYCFLPSISAIDSLRRWDEMHVRGPGVLFLGRLFGVTGSAAERDLAAEAPYIKEIVEKILLMQANAAARQHCPLARGTHAKGVCA